MKTAGTKQKVAHTNKRQLATILGIVVAIVVIAIVAATGQHNNKQSRAASSTGLDTYRVLELNASDNDFVDTTKYPITQTVLQQEAEHFSVIVNNAGSYKGQVAQMHAWSTDSNSTNGGQLSVLLYQNGSHTLDGCQGAVSAGAMAVDSLNHYLYSGAWGDGRNYLHDITNSAWWSYVASTAQANLTKSGYDGVWFDLLGDDPLRAGYNQASDKSCTQLGKDADDGNSVPANSSGTPYTPAQWAAGGAGETAAVRAKLGASVPIGFNGSRPVGNAYNADGMFTTADIGMDENWMFARNDPTYPSLTDWKNDVDEIVHVANLPGNKRLQVYTKMFLDPQDSPSMQQAAVNSQDAIHMFTLASFLLGTDGNQLYQFKLNEQPSSWTPVSKDYPNGVPWYQNLLIGHPTSPKGGYTTISCTTSPDCIYMRTFTQGYVFVNPTTTAKTIPATTLTGTFKDLDGNQKVYTATAPLMLQPDTAQILLTTTPVTPTVTVTITAPVITTVSGKSVTLSATATVPSPDTITGISFGLQQAGTTIGSCTTSPCSITWDSTAIANGTYTLVAEATSTDQGTGSNTATITVNNPPPPPVCNGLPTTPIFLTKNLNTATSVEIFWNPSTASAGCTMKDYLVYRNGMYIGSTTNTYYTDNDLQSNTTYTYTLQAEDTNSHLSPVSAPYATKTDQPTASVVILSPVSGSIVRGDITIHVSLTGNIDHLNYVIDRIFLTQTTASSPDAVWRTFPSDNGQHLIKVNAFNSANGEVASSDVIVTVNNTFCIPDNLLFGRHICL